MLRDAALVDINPLPQAYVTQEPGLGGSIKVRPEDFLVDELPLYDPCGEGEHLYLGIQKTRVSHSELIGTLCRHFHVRPGAIGFAGMKDKQGVTRQVVSLHLPGKETPEPTLPHERIDVLWAQRHRNKIRRGHLAGNRFSIRIRDVDAILAPRVLRVLRRLEKVGVPCYFDAQRFGYRRNNHLIGAFLLRGQWTTLLDELLGAKGSRFPEYQQERRELYDAGRLEEAVSLWTPADRAELIAAKALLAGRSPKEACVAVGTTTLSFWLSALQSAVFNRVLDLRLQSGTLDHLLDGDLAWKHDSRSVFAVTEAELADPEFAGRIERLEISPSGPIWGSTMTRPGDAVAAVEEGALTAVGLTVDEVAGGPRPPVGARRAFRSAISNIEVDSGVDEHGHYIRTAFDLPRGVYATIALREVLKNA